MRNTARLSSWSAAGGGHRSFSTKSGGAGRGHHQRPHCRGTGAVIPSGSIIVRGGKIVSVSAGSANTQGLKVIVVDKR